MRGGVTWRFRQLPSVGSTQDVVRELARHGEPEGLVVSSLVQSSGRGRYGRNWVSPSGGLYMSLLLRPRRTSGLQLITMIGALAVVDGIRGGVGVDSWIRWPNDVTIGGKKVAGAIAEAEYRGSEFSHLVLGIGINCNFRPEALGEFSDSSTTLSTILRKRVSTGQLRKRVASSFATLYSEWNAGQDIALVGKLASHLGTLGRGVAFETSEGSVLTGRAERLQNDGSLVVTTAGGPLMLRGEQARWLREA